MAKKILTGVLLPLGVACFWHIAVVNTCWANSMSVASLGTTITNNLEWEFLGLRTTQSVCAHARAGGVTNVPLPLPGTPAFSFTPYPPPPAPTPPPVAVPPKKCPVKITLTPTPKTFGGLGVGGTKYNVPPFPGNPRLSTANQAHAAVGAVSGGTTSFAVADSAVGAITPAGPVFGISIQNTIADVRRVQRGGAGLPPAGTAAGQSDDPWFFESNGTSGFFEVKYGAKLSVMTDDEKAEFTEAHFEVIFTHGIGDIADDESALDSFVASRTINGNDTYEETGKFTIDLPPSPMDQIHWFKLNTRVEAIGMPVPEPASIALLGLGLVGLAGAEVRRRRKKKAVDKS